MRRLEQQEDESVHMLACKRNYGIVLNRRWSNYRHNQRDAFQDQRDGRWKARDQMDWLLKKGDLMLSGKPTVKGTEFHWKFSPQDATERSIKFVTYEGADAQEALADLPTCKFPLHALITSEPFVAILILP
jgi:hypothetical protein